MLSLLAALAMPALAVPSATPLTLLEPGDPGARRARVEVQLDRRGRELVVTVGPFHVAQSMAMHHDMDMMMMQSRESLVGRFDWPVTAQFHGISLAVVDGRGGALPRRLLHHTYMVNFDRRQLVYPIIERTFSFGQETQDLATPASIGMPMARGQRMGIMVMWHNETGHDVPDAYIRYTFRLNPRRQWPPPIPVLPFFVDAHAVAGGADTFSVAPGGRTVTAEFTVPVSGRIIAASGHLHDHADLVRLEDARSGHVMVTVRARRDAAGRVLSVSRELPGLWGRGPHLRAGRRYRLVVRYDNPTADTLAGMMGMMGGLFVADAPSDWPAIDSTNADYLADLRGLLGSRPPAVTAAPSGGEPRPGRH